MSDDKKKVDYKQVELFGKCNLPVDDMSAILGISSLRIQRWMDNDRSKFYQSYRKGQALTRFNISQRQIAVATGEATGNPTLLAHLGGVLLGQNTTKNQSLEPKQDTAEKLIQNVSPSQREHIFSTLMGISDNTDTIDDESDNEAYKGEKSQGKTA